jgi:hypothetical protein
MDVNYLTELYKSYYWFMYGTATHSLNGSIVYDQT